MQQSAAVTTASPNPARSRLKRHRAGRHRRRLPFWRLSVRVCLAGSGLLGLAIAAASWLNKPPRVEPPFERIVGPGAGPIKDFALRDVYGVMHTNRKWRRHHAVVLFFIGAECPVSNGYAPEMTRLAEVFGPRGIGFFGIHTDPEITSRSAVGHAAEYGLPFPILLDPHQKVARQAGVRVTPEAVVVLPGGEVLYRGRIDDRYSPGGQRRPEARAHDLELALQAILADEMPPDNQTSAFGCPLPPRAQAENNQETITFARDVAPILWKNCARCHRPGAVGPFSLLTYKDAAKRADFIRMVTASGRMPPWKPLAGAGVFLDEPLLSPVEKEVLRTWAETGCEEGELADLPEQPRFADGWQLGEPELVLTMPEPFPVPPAGDDIYRAFLLPLDLDRDLTIVGVEFRPGNRRIVHHCRVHFDPTGDARRRETSEAGPGFNGWFGGPSFELPYPGIGAWTPGMTPRLAADGVGRVIPRGSDIVVHIHYHQIGKPQSDQSSVGLFLAKKPVSRSMAGLSISTARIDIPPGERRHMLIQSTRLKADIHLYAVVPHAHYLCREFRLAATLPDGTIQPLLWITDWNADWQDQYRYAKPVRLPKGTLLTFAAYFDNSDGNPRNPNKPPRRVRFGPGTKDEMCACHLEFLPDDPSGYEVYKQKSPFGL
jgi:peroxiredoxin